MAIPRVIPVLLLKDEGLVKTVRFRNPKYIGDPLNTVRIFNEKEADELILLNISSETIPWELLREIAGECFMPLAYGGGIKTLEDVRSVLKTGIEKVIINSQLYASKDFLREAIREFGSSSVVASLDVKKSLVGKYELYSGNGRHNTHLDPVLFARELEQWGIGEIIVNSVDREGTGKGYDLKLLKEVSAAVSIPVIISGGAATLEDLGQAIHEGGAAAAAAGSMFVFHGKHRAVLINYPSREELKRVLSKR